MSTTEKQAGRRKFLSKGLAVLAVGLGSLKFGLKQMLAQAQTPGKPPQKGPGGNVGGAGTRIAGKPRLTEESVNALIPDTAQEQRILALEARRNLKGFLQEHFTMTPQQRRNLQAMPTSEIAKVQNAIDQALQKRYRLQVRTSLPAAQSPPPGAMMRAEAGGAESGGWKVGGVEIKADASYSSGTREFEGTVSISLPCKWF